MKPRPNNVGEGERIAAGFLAAILIARSLRSPSPLCLLAAGCLIYRAVSGHCYGYEWLGTGTCKLKR